MKSFKQFITEDDDSIDKTKFWKNPKTNRLNYPNVIKGKVREFDGYKQQTDGSLHTSYKNDEGSHYSFHENPKKRRSLDYWDNNKKERKSFSSWDDLENHIKNNSEKKE